MSIVKRARGVALKPVTFSIALVLAVYVSPMTAQAQSLPAAIVAQLPPDMRVMASASGRPVQGVEVYFVALASNGETRNNAKARPALLFQRRAGGPFRLVGRNEHIVLRADEGGQCDPFEFGAITARGAYVTFENSVACGYSHWTDYITFKFNTNTQGYVFDNKRYQNWRFNPDQRPDAEVLISDGVRVTRAQGHPVGFDAWRRRN